MTIFCDSSVLISALLPTEDHHAASAAVLNGSVTTIVHVHALNETFSTLTDGSLGFRVDADLASRLIRAQIVSRTHMIALDAEEIANALDKARGHRVRGGAVYDYMHLVAARKGKADFLYTLNTDDFQHLHRNGGPEIRHP